MDMQTFWQKYDCQRTKSLDQHGQGSIYPAIDKESGAEVAIKVAEIHPNFDNNGAWGIAYQSAISHLKHPYLVPYKATYRWELDNWVHYSVVMPIYPLGSILNFNPSQDWTAKQKHDTFLAIAEALGYLHDNGYYMQNLHAGHVLITQEEEDKFIPHLINYAQKDKKPLAFIHNYEYLAPEQFAADYTPNAQTDIWALGVLGYWMWTEQLPFGKKSTTVPNRMIQSRILEDEIPELLERVPLPYKTIIQRCLEKDPAYRWNSIHELLHQYPSTLPEAISDKFMPQIEYEKRVALAEEYKKPLWQRTFKRVPSKPISILKVIVLLILAIALGSLLNKL